MRYRRLGRTGLQISEVSLGTVELGLDYGVPLGTEHLRPKEEDAGRLLNRALDLGVNFIDTARAYGTSEDVIGRALKTRRREYYLCTKVSVPPADVRGSALTAHVRDSVTAGLRALQTDCLDVLKIHSITGFEIERGEMIAAMLEEVKAGRVRFVGASTYGEEAPLAALQDGRYDCLQVAVTALDRRMEENVLPLAAARDVGIVARSVLLRGVLTGRYKNLPGSLAALRSAVAQLEELLGPDVSSLPELAYRYVLAHPAVSSALVGTARVAELEDVLAIAGRPPLTPGLIRRIRQTSVSDPDQLNPAKWPSDAAEWTAPP